MSYVGAGGQYVQETSYQFVGRGGDYARPRRDLTCGAIVLSLLLLIPLLMYMLSGTPSQAFDCDTDFFSGTWEATWPRAQQDFCCTTTGRGCATTALAAPMPIIPPPTPPPAPAGPVDPFNCAVGEYQSWVAAKKEWCCRVHHKCSAPAPLPAPVGPAAGQYDCDAGFVNWQIGWSEPKKQWCCVNQQRACPMTEAFDCEAGFANWVAGWSAAKKAWCCSNKGKGCA